MLNKLNVFKLIVNVKLSDIALDSFYIWDARGVTWYTPSKIILISVFLFFYPYRFMMAKLKTTRNILFFFICN